MTRNATVHAGEEPKLLSNATEKRRLRAGCHPDKVFLLLVKDAAANGKRERNAVTLLFYK